MPTPSTRPPHHAGPPPSRSSVTRTKPYTPILITTPDISADTWLGATGCAIGSHTCSGTTPALAPKPRSASTKTASRTCGVRDADRIAAKEVVRSPADRRRNVATSAAKLACMIAMYQCAARTVPGRSCSVSTIMYAESDMASHGDEERQRVVGDHLHAQRQQQDVQHRAQQAERRAPLVRRRVAVAVHGDRGRATRPTTTRKNALRPSTRQGESGQRQERRGERRRDAGAETHGAQPQPGERAHERAPGGEAASRRAADGERGERPDRVRGEDHQSAGDARGPSRHPPDDEKQDGHRRPIAARMPCRMAVGSGGHPSTKTSTGMI